MTTDAAQLAWGVPRLRSNPDGAGPVVGYGISLPTSGPFASVENVIAAAELAESLGLDDVWVSDRYSLPKDPLRRIPVGSIEAASAGHDPNNFESLITLATVGGRLSRIGLGAHALVLPLREIRLLTKQIATLQELAGGRLTIAPSIGSENNFGAMGVSRAERGKRMDEGLQALTAILGSEHPVSFDGQFTNFADATFYPRPQGIRLWVTGDSEPALRRVASFATGWYSTAETVDRFPELLARLDALASEEGRDTAEIDRATFAFVCLADSTEEALDISRATLERRYGSLEIGLTRAAIGDAQAVSDHLRRRIAMGYTYFELRFICHDAESYREMLTRVATEVVPAVRTLPAQPVSRPARPGDSLSASRG